VEAIILVGGKGTRLRSLVSDRPKPLADVNGTPFLDFLLTFLTHQNCKHFIFATSYMSDAFTSLYGTEFKGIPISYSFEAQPLGTGGAVIKAKDMLQTGEPFLVVNGDTFFPIELSALVDLHHKTRSDISIALFQATEDDRFDLVETNRYKTLVIGKGKAKTGDLACGGVFIMTSSSFAKLTFKRHTLSLENDVLPNLISNGIKLTGLPFDTRFIDIGIPSEYLYFCANHMKMYHSNID